MQQATLEHCPNQAAIAQFDDTPITNAAGG